MSSEPSNEFALKQWVAESLIRQLPEQNIKAKLVATGYDEDYALSLLEEAKPYIAAFPEIGRELAKRDWLLDVLHRVQRQSAHTQTIERRSVDELSREAFIEQYYTANRPVIVTGAFQDWPALKKWTPEYLLEQFGEDTVEVQTQREADPIYEHNAHQHKARMPFHQFIAMVLGAESSNDFYMTGNNMEENNAVLKTLFEDMGPLPPYLEDRGPDGQNAYFWFGPAGTITKLHHDICNGFLAQMYGRKLIKLISPLQLPHMYHYLNFYSRVDLEQPDLDQYPLFKEVEMTEVILHPGEMLFIPVAWWHYVRALDISISLSFNNFCAPNTYPTFYEVAGPDPEQAD